MSNQQGYPTNGPVMYQQRYDPNNPPFVPRIPCAETVAPYLGYLTGMMMDMISSGASGPITMHFYNHMSDNQWRNADFDNEVQNCADFIFIKTGGQRMDGNQVGQVYPKIIAAYLQLRSMFEVHLYQGLWQFVQQQDQNDIRNQIAVFGTEINEIMSLRSSNQAPQPSQMARGGGYAPPAGQTSGAYNTGASYAPVGSGGGRPGGGRDYGNVAPVQQQSAPPMYAAPAQPIQRPQTNQPTTKGTPMSAPQGTIVDPATQDWKPSEAYPHPMAYNPIAVKMMYQIENDKTLPYITKTEFKMIDYDRHSISSLFGTPPANSKVVLDNGELIRELQAGAIDAKEEDNTTDESGARLSYSHALTAWATATTLEGAIQDVRTDAAANMDKNNPPMVFQAYAMVYTPIMGATSEAALIKKFADSSTYVELREKLKAAGETASVELVSEVGLMLTAHLNHILHKELSILPKEILVDDFTNDLDQLLTILKSVYGDKVLKAFLKNQAQRIKSLFMAPDVDEANGKNIHEQLSNTLFTQSWEGRDDLPTFTFFGKIIRVSMINVVSHDLQVAGLPKVGNILTKAHQPALLELAVAVFSSENLGQPVAHQLVITKDGRILELTQTALVEGSYLVSLVK